MQISKLQKQPWFIPTALTVGIGLVILLSNRPVSGPDGSPLINNPSHYNEVLKEADNLVQQPFYLADSGGELSEEDKTNLRKAIELFKGLNAYQPTKLGPYLGAGKAYALLGEYEAAETQLRQLVSNMSKYENNEQGKMAVVESAYVLSQIRFGQKKYDEAFEQANIAVLAAPQVPNYLVARAAAEVQLGELDAAREDVKEALSLDPNHEKAKRLQMLLKRSKK